jgi:hypothetical protein
VFHAGDTPWSLVAVPGAAPAWSPGPVADAQLELTWDPADALAVWRREQRGELALASATAHVGDYRGPPCPGDLPSRAELDALPRLPDASVTAQYTFTDGPFGDVHHVLRFEDGRLVGDSWGPADDAEVRVRVPYEMIPGVRSGELSILEAIAHGTIDGEIGPMAVLAGILEMPEFQAAERAVAPNGVALAALGHLDADPAFTAAMESLAARTDPR